MPDRLEARGRELLATGFTPLRALRRLKREFPERESLEIKVAVGLGPKGITPIWADRSGNGRSVVVRNDPRQIDELTVTVRVVQPGEDRNFFLEALEMLR